MSTRVRIGLISDTHGLLRPEALAALAAVDHIIHAGDIGGIRAGDLDGDALLEKLRGLAPVTAVRGNNDLGPWADALAETASVQLDGRTMRVVHDLKQLAPAEFAAGYAAIVCGHSHRPQVLERDGTLIVNPGSAGPRRFSLPVAVGFLELDSTGVRARIQSIR